MKEVLLKEMLKNELVRNECSFISFGIVNGQVIKNIHYIDPIKSIAEASHEMEKLNAEIKRLKAKNNELIAIIHAEQFKGGD